MKITVPLLLISVLTSCISQKVTAEKLTNTTISSEINYEDVIIEINAAKTHNVINEWMDIYVIIKNNSNEDIRILKPSTKYGRQMSFFSVSYDCEDESVIDVPNLPPSVVEKTDKDIITIKPGAFIECKLKGNLYDVICNSISISDLKISYDTTKELSDWFIKEIGSKQIELKDKLTPLKIQGSKMTVKY